MDGLLVAMSVAVGAAALLWLGYQLAADKLHRERQQLKQEKAALQAEWRQLDQTRRVRAVFLTARRAMQQEAMRSACSPADVDQGGDR